MMGNVTMYDCVILLLALAVFHLLCKVAALQAALKQNHDYFTWRVDSMENRKVDKPTAPWTWSTRHQAWISDGTDCDPPAYPGTYDGEPYGDAP